jgi:tetratricopeptide (TPR) repeat protein
MLLTSIADVQAAMQDKTACLNTLKAAEGKAASLPSDRSDDMWGELGASYILIGDKKAAEAAASKIRVQHTWAEWLRRAAGEFAKRGEFAKAAEYVKQAEDNAMADTFLRAQLKKLLAEIQAKRGDLPSARKTAEGIEIAGVRIEAFVEIAAIARKTGDRKGWEELIGLASKATEAQTDGLDRIRGLQALVAAYAEGGQQDKAVALVAKLPQGDERAEGWLAVASAQIAAGQRSAAKSSLQEARKELDAPSATQPGTTRSMRDPWMAMQLANLYARAGEVDQALKLCEELPPASGRRGALRTVSEEASRAGQVEALMAWARRQQGGAPVEVHVGVAAGLIPEPKPATQSASQPVGSDVRN